MSILIHVSVAFVRDDCLLLVQEQKPSNYGLWNLPGGHLEVGETLQEGAKREAREETTLDAVLTSLVGIYTTLREPDYHAIRYVFRASSEGEATAGDEIIAVRWTPFAEIASMPDSELVGKARLRQIAADVQNGLSCSLSLLHEPT